MILISEQNVGSPDLAGQFAGRPHQVQAGYLAGDHCHGGDRDEVAFLVDGEPRRPVDEDAVDHVAWLFLGEDAERRRPRPRCGRYPGHAIFYVGVPNVEAALADAERLGGKRQMGPERAPTGLVVGHFTDPEGNLIGVAGTA
jgi:hypothetical protein